MADDAPPETPLVVAARRRTGLLTERVEHMRHDRGIDTTPVVANDEARPRVRSPHATFNRPPARSEFQRVANEVGDDASKVRFLALDSDDRRVDGERQANVALFGERFQGAQFRPDDLHEVDRWTTELQPTR